MVQIRAGGGADGDLWPISLESILGRGVGARELRLPVPVWRAGGQQQRRVDSDGQ